MSRKRRLLFGLVPVLFIANTLVLPVSILKDSQPNKDSQEWAQIPLATLSVTEITHVSGSPVQIVNLQLPWPQVFNLDAVELNEKPVSTISEIVLDSGDVLKISGMYSDLSLIAQSQGTASTIELIRSSDQNPVFSNTLDLLTGNTNKEIEISSPESIWVNQSTVLEAMKENYASDSEIIEFSLAQRPLNANDVSSNAPFFFKATSVTFLNWLAFFSVFAFAAFFWLIGALLWNSKAPDILVENFLRIVLGFTLFGLLLNTANFFLPGVQATLLIITLFLGLFVFRFNKTKTLSKHLSESRLQLKNLARLSMPTFVPLIVAFWPVFLFGFRFSGETKTDFSEYSTLASFLRDSSMIAMQSSSEAQSAGVLTSGAGFSWRSIDSAISSAFGTALGSNSFYGITLLSMFAFYIFILGLALLFSQDSNSSTKRSLFWVGLLATYPLISTVSLESYLSQFVFICLMPAVVISVMYYLKKPNDKISILQISSLLAFLGALYPYFLAITIAGVIVSLLINSKQTRMQLRILVRHTFLKTLLLLNVAVLPIVFYFETNVYQATLNEIARVTLLGPYSTLERIGLIGGVTTYEWRHWGEAPGEYLGFATGKLWIIGSLLVERYILLLLILLVLAAVGFILFSVIKSSRGARISLETHILFSVFLVWSGVFFYYVANGSTYIALKVLLVAATAGVILIARLTRSIPRIGLAFACTGLFAIWLPVNMLERSNWTVDPLMPEVRYSHITSVHQIDELRTFLAQNDYTSAFVAFGEEPLQGSDRDRVLMFNTKTVLHDLRIDCLDCEETLPAKDLGCNSSPIDPLIVIGASSVDKSCNRREVFSSGLISVYE